MREVVIGRLPDGRVMPMWRVGLSETIGTQVIEGVVRWIPALSKAEAGRKAVSFQQKRVPGSNPSVRFVELEDEMRPIKIL